MNMNEQRGWTKCRQGTLSNRAVLLQKYNIKTSNIELG